MPVTSDLFALFDIVLFFVLKMREIAHSVRISLVSQTQAQLIQHKSQRAEYHVIGMVPFPVSNQL